jgi:hypothetical protein
VFEFSNERQWWEEYYGPGIDQEPTEELVANMHTLIQMLDEADPPAAVDSAEFERKIEKIKSNDKINNRKCSVDVFFACKPFTAGDDVVNPLDVVTKRLGWLAHLHEL